MWDGTRLSSTTLLINASFNIHYSSLFTYLTYNSLPHSPASTQACNRHPVSSWLADSLS
jgi:hypothetical protein